MGPDGRSPLEGARYQTGNNIIHPPLNKMTETRFALPSPAVGKYQLTQDVNKFFLQSYPYLPRASIVMDRRDRNTGIFVNNL